MGRMVYMRSEWDIIPEEAHKRLRTCIALCDCEAANPPPNALRPNLTQLYQDRLRNGTMTTIQRIRDLARSRLQQPTHQQKEFTL
jgi:hypothetical protein